MTETTIEVSNKIERNTSIYHKLLMNSCVNESELKKSLLDSNVFDINKTLLIKRRNTMLKKFPIKNKKKYQYYQNRFLQEHHISMGMLSHNIKLHNIYIFIHFCVHLYAFFATKSIHFKE